MLDIVSHFFILYPLITFNKDSQLFAKTGPAKFLFNLGILTLAAILTGTYMMDSSLIQSGPRDDNMYEIFETSPQEFAQLNSTLIKRMYRDLSRKYHPDKNPEEDTTDKFMKIKQAFEILHEQEKRILYDVYGQTDFSQDDKMKDMIEVKFKDPKEREDQFKAYKGAQSSMKVFGEVVPYYLAWLLLTMYRIDVSKEFFALYQNHFHIEISKLQRSLWYGDRSLRV